MDGHAGPISPVAMARAGRSGTEIQRTMQPISIVGYGAAFLLGGPPALAAAGACTPAGLIAAALLGTGLGFAMRRRVAPALVVRLVRFVACVGAVLLISSLFR